MIPLPQALAYVSLGWGLFVLCVQSIGIYKIFKYYSSVPKKPVSPTLPRDDLPHVTIIRPAKGLEPSLYECLASSFRQSYPRDKLAIHFCVPSRDDPAYSTMRRVIDDFPGYDARLFIEDEDPLLHGHEGNIDNLGPNPKIRNMSRAYREMKGDAVWIVDCNVWIANDVAGRMVDRLYGFAPDGKQLKPHKLVHLLPLVVDTVSSLRRDSFETQALLSGSSDTTVGHVVDRSIWSQGGGRLEEMFLSTTHAKFYGAINTVGVAPCIVGKSTMFRKSHLDMVTDPARNPILPASFAHLPTGLDHFSNYICEDHLIGDLLWRSNIPGHKNHGLVWGDLAIQPMAGMSVAAYIARRVRWLRVRKWTVMMATFVEHGIESLVCCFYTSYGITTIPWFHERFGISQTWGSLGQGWFLGLVSWMIVDRIVSNRLHAGYSLDIDENTPPFAKGSKRGGAERRPFGEWFLAWLGREILALPIWIWACLLGTNVSWRGRRFRVRPDMSVVSIDTVQPSTTTPNGRVPNKAD